MASHSLTGCGSFLVESVLGYEPFQTPTLSVRRLRPVGITLLWCLALGLVAVATAEGSEGQLEFQIIPNVTRTRVV